MEAEAPETLSAQQAADLIGVFAPTSTCFSTARGSPTQRPPAGTGESKRADIENYRDRRTRAHDAMHDAMAAAEDLAPDGV